VLNGQTSSVDIHRFINDVDTKTSSGQNSVTQDNSFNEDSKDEAEVMEEVKEEMVKYEEIVTLSEFRESIKKVELFLRQSDLLFDAAEIQLFEKFKSRLDLIQ